MFAQVSGLKAGELVHVIADAHIYDRHVPIIKEVIEKPQYPAPKFWINPDVKNFTISPSTISGWKATNSTTLTKNRGGNLMKTIVAVDENGASAKTTGCCLQSPKI